MSEEYNLWSSVKTVGEIYPVIKDQYGNILDGRHRKKVNPNWKETAVEVKDELEALLIRVHANIMRREVSVEEKQEWVREARRILQARGMKGTQEEIAKVLGLSQRWVSKYDLEPYQKHNVRKLARRANFDNTDLETFLQNYAEALKKMPKPNHDNRVERFIAFARKFFEENNVCCPICGEKKLVWRCGHEF